MSFQDWNLLPSQILDNLYVSTNRSHRHNDVYICIYICTWEKWTQKRHKADRLEKGRGYRTKVKQVCGLWAQTTELQFQDSCAPQERSPHEAPKHIRLPTQKTWLSWGEEASALNCVSNHQHLQKYSKLPNMISGCISRLEYHKTGWTSLKWVNGKCLFCWILLTSVMITVVNLTGSRITHERRPEHTREWLSWFDQVIHGKDHSLSGGPRLYKMKKSN